MSRSLSRRWLPFLLTMLAFFLRVWQLDQVPPGWSDDELSNILVISQKIFQGDRSLYYVDATGLEAPYHVASGFFLRILGFNALGIRLLSAILGTLAVPLLYQVGRRLFSPRVGLLAAALLATSFWALVYSRVNLRHVALPVFLLFTFFWFWQGMVRGGRRPFLAAGLGVGLGFYTYFAARGIPLILVAFAAYLALVYGAWWRRRRLGIALTLLLAALLAAPLLWTLQRQEGADARVAEVAVPLVAARSGDFEPLREHVGRTLRMFHADGDDEFLYNIPGRAVFGLPGALAFWSGVLLAGWYALQPLARRRETKPRHLAAAFLLLWWLAGITPGFLSVPPASLGHTIVAQPATYLLAALPLQPLARRWRRIALLLGLLLLAAGAARDLPDYYGTWPQRGNTRFLYHADVRNVADFVATQPGLRDFAISGLLAGPWYREALRLDLANAGVGDAAPRWYDPRRAVILTLGGEPAVAFAGYPQVDTAYESFYTPLQAQPAGGYTLFRVGEDEEPAATAETAPVCFQNGLCLLVWRLAEGDVLHLTWQVARPLILPPQPLLSKPPPPGADDSPRLWIFAQLLDDEGVFLVGDDGLWVDPAALQAGDRFRQQHHLPLRPGSRAATLAVGLYDPLTGERVPTETGRDHLSLPVTP